MLTLSVLVSFFLAKLRALGRTPVQAHVSAARRFPLAR